MQDCIKHFISKAAQQAPTGDNCQPFKLTWEENVLFITHDDEVAKHRLNYKNCASLLSLGAVIESVEIAAHDTYHAIQVSYDKENPLKEVRIEFTESKELWPSGLSEFLEKRHTDRRIFKKGWTPGLDEEIEKITRDYAAKVTLHHELPEKVYHLFLKLDAFFWKEQGIFFDTISWVRFNMKKALGTKDGITAKNLGLNLFTGAILWIASRSSFTQKLMAKVGAISEGRKILQNQLQSAAGFIFINNNHLPTAEGLVQTGRVGLRVWVELTKKGYSVQPITIGTLFTNINAKNDLKSHFNAEFVEALKEGSEIMTNELELPVWGFRFGKVEKVLPKEAWTYRRDVAA